MPHAFDSDSVVILSRVFFERFVLGVLIGLSGDDRDFKLGCEVFAKFRKELSSRFRIRPVGPIEEQDVWRSIFRVSRIQTDFIHPDGDLSLFQIFKRMMQSNERLDFVIF